VDREAIHPTRPYDAASAAFHFREVVYPTEAVEAPLSISWFLRSCD
jgi:hypothetical protein